VESGGSTNGSDSSSTLRKATQAGKHVLDALDSIRYLLDIAAEFLA
jgi:hypothetical protein